MAVSRADTQLDLGQLSESFGKTESVIVMEYKGLKVPEVTELRRQVRAVQGSYKVVKNTLARRAMAGTAFEALTPHFTGTTAVAFSGDDPVALAKVLTTFAKTAPALVLKAAVVQGEVVEGPAVAELATMPGKPGRYAQGLFLRLDRERAECGAARSDERADAGGEEEGRVSPPIERRPRSSFRHGYGGQVGDGPYR